MRSKCEQEWRHLGYLDKIYENQNEAISEAYEMEASLGSNIRLMPMVYSEEKCSIWAPYVRNILGMVKRMHGYEHHSQRARAMDGSVIVQGMMLVQQRRENEGWTHISYHGVYEEYTEVMQEVQRMRKEIHERERVKKHPDTRQYRLTLRPYRGEMVQTRDVVMDELGKSK